MNTMPYIKIGCWNIQGIVSNDADKTRDPLFLKEIEGFDIIGLTETHTVEGQHDNIKIEGYHTICFHRPKHFKAKHGSGGITILVKHTLRSGVKMYPSKNKDYVWLKLGKSYFNLNQDIHLCVAYIPPQDSTYSKRLNQNLLDQVETDIYNYKKEGEVILMGDLNARVGTSQDFIKNDSDNHIPLDNNYTLDTPQKPRTSCDKTLDNRGKHLLEICIGAQLRMLNGRKLGDTVGYHTCHQYNGSSVVDYALCSESLLMKIPYFKVHNFIGTLSDHCMISFTVRTTKTTNSEQQIALFKMPCQFKWSEHSQETYAAALDLPPIQKLTQEIEETLEDANDVASLNLATQKVTSVMIEAAKLSLKLKKKRGKTERKPWYTHQLKSMERQVNRKAMDMVKYKTGEHRRSFFLSLKLYRKERKYTKRHYINKQISELNDLKKHNPKKFWQTLQVLNDENTDQNHASNIEPGKWYDYLSSLNKSRWTDTPQEISNEISENQKHTKFSELDYTIKKQEITNAIKKLKSNKSAGLDTLSNEMIKASVTKLLPNFHKLFNVIYTTGEYPDLWTRGYITTIHKKGPVHEPANYRGITITSTLGKLFNSVLCTRLQNYLEDNNLISNLQIGFEKESGTSDHLFTLKTLIDKYSKKKGQKLYACFVDFRQAFDRVWHPGLLLKLTRLGINNHFFRIIQNMYGKTNLCVKVHNDEHTPFFKSNIGVRQGDNLSPTLFKIYINDLTHAIMKTTDTDPVQLGSSNLNCLLYADDIVLLSTSQKGLQNCINSLKSYSDTWKLEINQQKTKVLIFNKDGHHLHEHFYYGADTLETTDNYTYLGINLDSTGSASNIIDTLYKKGLKALYKLNKLLNHNYDIQTVLHIFDHTVKPVLLYGSEVWGIELAKLGSRSKHAFEKNLDTNALAKLELKFYRRLLQVKRTTSIAAIRGELGRHPISSTAIANSIKYLNVVRAKPKGKLVRETLDENIRLSQSTNNCSQSKINKLTDTLKTRSEPLTLTKTEIKKHAKTIENTIKSRYEIYWNDKLTTDQSVSHGKGGNKLRTYRLLKQNFKIEPYLTHIENIDERKATSQLRLSSHPLNIEAQRGYIEKPIDRICQLCKEMKTEDEIHFLMKCPFYDDIRKGLCDTIEENKNVKDLDNKGKFIWVLTNEDKSICKVVAKFIKKGLEARRAGLNQT